MTFLTLVLIIVIILAVIGLGWNTFAIVVLDGFDKTLDIGIPILRNLTQEAQAQSTTTSNANASYQTYENETANIGIQYPNDWIAETKSADPEAFEMVRIFPKELMAEQYPNVSFVVAFIPKEITIANTGGKPNLTGITEITLAGIEAEPDFRLINSSINENVTVSFANGTKPKSIPAFIAHLYDFSRLFVDSQEMDIGFIVDDNIVLFTYDAAQEDFDKYLPQVQKIIESFQLTTS